MKPDGASSQRNHPATRSTAAAGLAYVSDTAPGIRRVRRGARPRYLLPDGEAVTDEAELRRIAKLAIPPAYRDVWICLNPRGHLQATGRDARGRKQYRYHARWRSLRDGEKFERMPAFGEALPRLRRTIRKDLMLDGLPREKVLAIVVRLLDATRLRVGNAEYVRANDSYGLTTLRNHHVQFVRNRRLRFRFRGKGGTQQEITVDDRRLVALVRRCHQLPGQRLFQYIDDAGKPRAIDSAQVNRYLKEAMGYDFTAKDFRTWGATLRAIRILQATPLPEPASERALNACILDVVKSVAAELRNTPAVCRKSYINPVVFDAWRSGALQRNGQRRRAPLAVIEGLRREAAKSSLTSRIRRSSADRAAATRHPSKAARCSTNGPASPRPSRP